MSTVLPVDVGSTDELESVLAAGVFFCGVVLGPVDTTRASADARGIETHLLFDGDVDIAAELTSLGTVSLRVTERSLSPLTSRNEA